MIQRIILLLKGKALPVGHISHRKNGPYQKQQNGKWKPVQKVKGKWVPKEKAKPKPKSKAKKKAAPKKKRKAPKKKVAKKKKAPKKKVISKKTDYGRDTGKKVKSGKIPGSKLEMIWQKKFQNFEEMEATGVAHKIVNKKNLITDQTDLDLQEKMGRDPRAAHWFNDVVKSIRAYPKVDTPEARKFYYEICHSLIDSTKNAKSMEDMLEGLQTVKDRAEILENEYKDEVARKGGLDARSQAWKHFDQIVGKKLGRRLMWAKFNYDQYDKETGYVRLSTITYENLRGEQSRSKERRKISAAKARETRKKSPEILRSKEKAERKGLKKHYNNEGKASKSFETDFKFRTLPQHGKSLPDAERKYHVMQAANSFADLAKVLGLSKEQISGNGKLAIAFGARGSGKASAHYEPSLKVINLTRNRGGGSVAHEWAHFFDNIVPMYDSHRNYTHGSYISHRESYSGTEDGVSYKVYRLMKTINETDEKRSEVRSFHKKGKEESFKHDAISIENWKWRYGDTLLEKNNYDPIEATKKYLEKYTGRADLSKKRNVTALSDTYQFLYSKAVLLKKIKPSKKYENPVIDVHLKTTWSKQPTDFATGSKSQGAYWGRQHEMFARAFESYVATKLDDMGAKNTYLCEDPAEYNRRLRLGKGLTGTLYPQGREKREIDKAFDELFKSLKHESNKDLLKALSMV